MLGDPSQPAALLLSAVADRYDLPDVPTAEKLPHYPMGHPHAGSARIWVAHGQPGSLAADEEDPLSPVGSTTIALQRISAQTSSAGPQAPNVGHMTVHAATYHVRLLRRVPALGTATGSNAPPLPDDITGASLVLARDAARLVDALHAWAAALTIRGSVFTVDLSTPVEAISPQGMLGGNRASATLFPI